MTNDPNNFQNLTIQGYTSYKPATPHVLLDVRTIEEYQQGHIPGAINIPLDDLQERVSEVPTDQPVVVVCAHGVRSLYASQFLAYQGHPQVINLEGGTAAWEAARLPLER